MELDIYRGLQQMLDKFSVGFPRTDSGVEIEILKKLFSEDDAQTFLKLSPLLESTADLSAKLGLSEDEAAVRLNDMFARGLLFRLRKGDTNYYAAIPFIHGLFEFQVSRLEPELAKLVEKLMREKMGYNIQENGSGFLRTIPVSQSVDPTLAVAPYEDVEQILRSKDLIVVTECICRKAAAMVSDGCGKPREACFMFGSMGQYYLDRDMGRRVSADEALQIVRDCQAAGLVTQPASAQNPGGMCNCCGDCCGVLASMREHPRPAEIVFTNHYARLDRDECNSCGECFDLCQMDALTLAADGKAELAVHRCIGCGLCVIACSTGALSLAAKEAVQVPPKNSMEQMINLAKKRGIL